MKKLIAAAALAAVSLLPVRAFAQATPHDHAADSSRVLITVSQPLVVGTTILQPGDYKFQCRTFGGKTFLVVTAVDTGKEMVRVPCVRETLDAAVVESQFSTTAREDGKRVLTGVRIKGEAVAHRVVTD
jgi:hypothetical protein